MHSLRSFFQNEHFIDNTDIKYQPLQWGANILHGDFDPAAADIIIVGCDRNADNIRKHLYSSYFWHNGVTIADAGNIQRGATPADTRAALLTVLQDIHEAGKIALVLGGPHQFTLQQYDVFKRAQQMVNVSVADMLIDLDEAEETTDSSFLMDMLTGTPNFVTHYSHIGFQSYYAHPHMLQTLDKLRFDFFRLGKVKEHIEDMEPVLRNTNLFSFDINAIRYSDAPCNINGSPNGFTGEEACQLTRFAGMSTALTSLGIYGYDSANDVHDMAARQIAQMIWYFVDGYLVRRTEAHLTDKDEFTVFNVTFTDNDTTFIKSKRTNRWWMRLPDNTFVPCSYNDYLTASSDSIPERWLREQERLM
jgi:formiminoglutamase